MAGENISIAELLKANELADPDKVNFVVSELPKPPFSIRSVKQLASYFDEVADVRTLFIKQHKKMDEDGEIITALKMVYKEAKALLDRSLKRQSEDLPEENSDDPLREVVASNLKEHFFKTAKLVIVATYGG